MSGTGVKTKTKVGGGAPPLASAPEGSRRTPPNGGDPRNAPEEAGISIFFPSIKNIPLVRVRDISEQIRGVTYGKSDVSSRSEPGFIPILRAGNITDAGLVYDDLVFVPSKFVSQKQRIRRHDVLIAASSGSLDVVGKSAAASDNFNGGFGAFCKALRPNDNVHPGYFAHFFKTNEYRRKISTLAAGANINNLRNEHLEELLVPLPPMSEQRRIAEVLDRAEDIRRVRSRAIKALEALLESTFIDIFGDPVANPKKWPDSTELGMVADIVSGITKGRVATAKSMRSIPYLAVLNVQDKHLNLQVVKEIEATDEEIERYRLRENDLLLTEGGDPDKLGRGSLWKNEIPECIHQNHVFRVRLHSDKVSPLFLNWLVGSQRGKRYFLSQSKQTTGIASINMGQLRRFPLLMPPLSIQNEFARGVAFIEKIKSDHLASLAHLDSLFASLQDRAFRGEL